MAHIYSNQIKAAVNKQRTPREQAELIKRMIEQTHLFTQIMDARRRGEEISVCTALNRIINRK